MCRLLLVGEGLLCCWLLPVDEGAILTGYCLFSRATGAGAMALGPYACTLHSILDIAAGSSGWASVVCMCLPLALVLLCVAHRRPLC